MTKKNKKEVDETIEDIKENAKEIRRDITIMEICGGHTNTIMRYGIRDVLPENIHLISGPGCPVCVSSQHDIDCMIKIAESGVAVATYGDMLRVPGSSTCLEEARANGSKVFDVYSTSEVIKLKKEYPDIVFFGIGFETTAPMTAYLLKNKVCVYSVHKLIPPALKTLLNERKRIDGFINPGHVSTIIGTKAYRDINAPQVIAGFNPEGILLAIKFLTDLIKNKKHIVINSYPEVVKEEGNTKAQDILEEQFYKKDSEWRGIGIIPDSGLEVRNDNLNAKIKYKNILAQVPKPKKTGCRCADVLCGKIEPRECRLYRKICNPKNPKGACMVSEEGSCAIAYKYGR